MPQDRAQTLPNSTDAPYDSTFRFSQTYRFDGTYQW